MEHLAAERRKASGSNQVGVGRRAPCGNSDAAGTGLSRMKDWASRLLRKWSWASRMLSKSRVALICCSSWENWDSSTSTWWPRAGSASHQVAQMEQNCMVCFGHIKKSRDRVCHCQRLDTRAGLGYWCFFRSERF